MSILAGQLITQGNGLLVSRLQTAGPSNLGIPEEKIYELGNGETVTTLRDIPDLTWDGESLDMTTDIEALLTGVDPATVVAGQEFDFRNAKPLDVASPFKGAGTFDVVRGIALPYLVLDSMTYRFGVRSNATQSFTLRGDSIYYIPGTPYYEDFAAAGVGPYSFTNGPALKTTESGDDVYALCVTIRESDGSFQRLFIGDDYTNTANGFTLAVAAPVGSTVSVIYGSAVAGEFLQAAHPTVSVKPAAVRAKDIDFYVSDGGATPTLVRWRGVQSVDFNWRVQIEREEELGNPHAVDSGYDVPEVSGTVTMRAPDVEYLFDRIAQVTNVAADEIANTLSSLPLEIQARIRHPETGDVIKTLVCDDARFQPPPVQGRAGQNQKLEVQFPWNSDGGDMKVYEGEPV